MVKSKTIISAKVIVAAPKVEANINPSRLPPQEAEDHVLVASSSAPTIQNVTPLQESSKERSNILHNLAGPDHQINLPYNL